MNLETVEQRIKVDAQAGIKKKSQAEYFNLGLGLLADQGSNLDSSGPKPDVLPVTPSANH